MAPTSTPRAAEEAPAAGPAAPAAPLEPIEAVENDDLAPRDMQAFVVAAMDQDGLLGHNIQGFNQFLEEGLQEIMTRLFDVTRDIPNERAQTEGDRAIRSFQIRLQFHDVEVGPPTYPMYHTGQMAPLYPARARLTGLPYSGPITLGATATVRANYGDGRAEERTAEVPPFQISSFPIMVGSSRCHTHNCTREARIQMGEDPTDPGGYFIVGRGEFVVDLLENIRYNGVHLHRKQKAGELVRAEFLSQPGGAFENSSQIRVRYMANGQLTVEITSTKFEGVRLPFFVLYRLFGMTSDREVAETVVFDPEDRGPLTLQMLDVLERAFQQAEPAFAPLVGVIDHTRVVEHTAAQLARHMAAPVTTDAAVQYLNTDLLSGANRRGGLDAMLLPHMGQTPDARRRKLRLLGLIIRKVLLCHLGVVPPTDRDSYRNKRVHGAGVSLAKAFKTQVNNSVVTLILKAYRRELKNNPWGAFTEKVIVDTFRNALGTSDLNRAMEQAIKSGNKTIVVRRRVATNRVSSQALERKNGLNTFSALRTVVTQNAGNAAKQTKRAEEMRQVQPSYVGFICIAQSADTGENVGMRKQLAVTAGVCTAGEAVPLRRHLLADPDVIPLDAVAGPEMLRRDLARVFVNGEWLGCCASAPALAARYRRLRREGRVVDPSATIYWDPVEGEVEFWLDVGRLRRPLLIVDNNLEAYDAARRAAHRGEAGARPVAFTQNVRFTPAHVRAIAAGRLTLADLLAAGVAEYVTPEEQENCLLAPSIEVLRAARHDVTRRFTHCEVPQALFGLAAHVAPFANHTQPARVTYETNQGRQTGGWYALNFPWRTDKNRFFQLYNEVPLIPTLTHRFVPSNGSNVCIAYAPYGGDNMEDSAIINQASADRGLFTGAYFRFEALELEKGEAFCNPDPLTTKNLKPGACYEKLVDGFIRVGAVARYGDVLVGRVAKLGRGRGDGEFLYTDRSLVYKLHEPAVVEDTLKPRGANDELFGLVKLRFERPLRTGDKLSSRSGNKSIAALLLPQSDMPFTEDGITPDLIINTCSFPTRMIVGQMIEARAAAGCARRGALLDGTAFLPVDHEAHAADLVRQGLRYNGRHRMYNGLTGECFDAAIVMGPCHEQRLQKFVLDDEQAVAGSGPTDATTGQPLGGKHVQGGLRLGEMEFWCLNSQGAMLNVAEKLGDSDFRPLHVCRGCAAPAVYNEFFGIYECRTCGEGADIAVVDSSKTSILFQEELNASNIRLRLAPKAREFEAGAPDEAGAPAAADAPEEEDAAGPPGGAA